MCTGLDNIGAQRLSSGVVVRSFLVFGLLALCVFTFVFSRSGRHCVYSRLMALSVCPRGPCSQLPGLSTFGCHDHLGAYIESNAFAITNLHAFVSTDLDAFAATDSDHQQDCVAESAVVGR